ncbi:pyridoxamine 5'-phosphate oxidase family protein [Arenibacter sp. NBRC 103722]|jgi:hypothetical protein|nr:pyridoxamine 5'-phosphate oxidase family protein [Arenibacter sp. NBRC 103722]|tara:strand:- start:56178 stop:56750 length:573 start_codon:yes stop_codon:yes gene_type:complete
MSYFTIKEGIRFDVNKDLCEMPFREFHKLSQNSLKIIKRNMTNLTTSESIRLLKGNYTGHLGYIYQDKPYVLPITYYYDKDDHSLISYSADGHKIDAMRQNTAVTLLVEEVKSSNNWQSVMAHGTYEELQGTDAKFKLHQFTEGVKGLILAKEHRETEFISEFSSKLYSRGIPTVYRIKILEITGKRKET